MGGGLSVIAIPFDPRLHHFQEFDHYLDCEFEQENGHARIGNAIVLISNDGILLILSGLRRSHLVWWSCHRSYSLLFCADGEHICLILRIAPSIKRSLIERQPTSFQVGSSVIAAWTDITTAATTGALDIIDSTTGAEIPLPTGMIGQLNIGYLWMMANCLCSAAYVSVEDGLFAFLK